MTLGAIAAALLPLFLSLPPWVAGGALLILAWRAYLHVTGRPPPGTPLKVLLLVFALFAVVASFRGFGGASAGGAFLALTSAMKALESRTRRDFRIVALACWLLLAVAFLLAQSLFLALYAAPVAWLATLALLDTDATLPSRTRAARAARLLAAALPVALVFFLLFPRLPGPLFRFGAPQLADVAGLSETLAPGDLASLAQSEAVAFRVRFEGTVPARGLRYFRGPVLTHYDGRRWRPGRRLAYRRSAFAPRGRPVRYRVLERANGTHYLFALALPLRVSTPARTTSRYELLAPRPIWNDVAYTGVSFPRYTLQATLPPAERRADLALPQGIDPRARALAASWRNTGASPAAIVRTALGWFRREPFYYTLSPGRLSGPDRIDQFLFDTRRGFCEHYASAFAVLMRAAGIPARVVVGYAGGEVNPYDGWLVLRQSNAHAWDEVWLAGRGWVRIDPTGVIPPGRIEASAATVAASSPVTQSPSPGSGWYWKARNLWDAINTAWTEYVVGYGPALQHRLLGRLGLGNAGPFITALLMVALALAAGLLMFLLGAAHWRDRRRDPAQRLYLRWCRRLARRGPRRRPAEGALDFAARVAREAPEQAEAARTVAELYCAARYGGSSAALAGLRRRVGRLRRGPRVPAEEPTGRRGR